MGCKPLMDPEREKQLAELVDRWTSHMAWRSDFQHWRLRRLWQERYQEEHILQIDWASGGDIEGKHVLDLGCGMGGLAVALSLLGARVVAMDPNLDYLNITRFRAARYNRGLALISAAGEALPFRRETFDAVLALDVIEHCDQPALLLAEVHRVLKSHGWALVTVTNRYAFRDPHYHLPLINWLPRSIGAGVAQLRSKEIYAARDRQSLRSMHYFRWNSFITLARRCGFEAIPFQWRIRSSGLKGMLGDAAQIVGLYRPAYNLYRLLFRGTWTFKLKKQALPCL